VRSKCKKFVGFAAVLVSCLLPNQLAKAQDRMISDSVSPSSPSPSSPPPSQPCQRWPESGSLRTPTHIPERFIEECLLWGFFAYPNEVMPVALTRPVTVGMDAPQGPGPGRNKIAEVSVAPNGYTITSIRFLRPGRVWITFRTAFGPRSNQHFRFYRTFIEVRPRPKT
jgi:hypothetical protein